MNDAKLKKTLGIYLVAAATAAVVFIVLRCLFMMKYLDFEKEMYTNVGNLPLYFNCAMVAVCALLLTSIFFLFHRQTDNHYEHPTSTATTFASSLIGFLMIANFILDIYHYASGRADVVSTVTAGAANGTYGNVQHIFSLLVCLLSVPAAIYFFFVASSKQHKHNTISALSLTVVLWNAFLIIATYFDISVAFNSPIKIMNQISIIFVMLFMLHETRYHVGAPRPLLYFPLAITAVFVIAVSAIPDLILSMYYLLSVDMIYSGIQFTFLIYIIARLLSWFFPSSEPQLEKIEQTKLMI